MTVAKDIRLPKYTGCTHVLFSEPVTMFETDIVELDMRTHKARVTNQAGKVKFIVPFKVEEHGPTTTTGS